MTRIDPMVEQLEGAFCRPLPAHLEQLIDDRVRSAMTGTPRPETDGAGMADSRVAPGPITVAPLGTRRRKRPLLLAAAAFLVAATTAIAGALSREPQRPANPQLTEAMRGVADAMMTRCLDKAEATELLTSTLTRMGETDWSIRTDGPLAHPVGEGDAVTKHIATGCYIYSGSGSDAVGRPVIYISVP